MTTRYARQAIETYTLAATNTRGDRVVAQCAAKRRVYSIPIDLNNEEVHIYAMARLSAELGWNHANWYMGVIKNGHYVHVDITDYRK